MVLTNRVRVEIWRTWGQADGLHASRRHRVTQHVAEPWIDRGGGNVSAQASINRISELATHWTPRHCPAQGGCRRSPRIVREVDHEQDREARQTSGRPEFDREEIRGRQDASVRAQELLTGRRFCRSGAGSIPCCLRVLAMVPRLESACSLSSDFPSPCDPPTRGSPP